MIKILLAFMAGAAFGVMMICCCVAAGRADRMDEQQFEQRKQKDGGDTNADE
ncbi:MAG: hypothetical protein IJH37_07245 [Clostridia bacterium]|nr:hypothetical protein [Clostridia bacterium]